MVTFIEQFFLQIYDLLLLPEFYARLQFASTVILHFIFPPLTIGLSMLVAIMETFYAFTGKEHYKRMTKFWGRLFLINFAAGVVTGIVMEFEFGMNWSQFSGYVGDIFGVPLAIEVLLAFFLESTFIGLWIFGWDKFSRKVHALFIWIVAIGTLLSAFWILTANSFMQEPVGYVIRNGRAELVDFVALFTSTQFILEFFHTWFAAIITASFFVLGISAYHLWKKTKDTKVFQASFKAAVIYSFIGVVGVAYFGDAMAVHIAKEQPMKLAAMEALWETADPAPEGIVAIPNMKERKNSFEVSIPYGLTFLVYKSLSGSVAGINDLQAEYEKKYGPGDYIPDVFICYYAFRIMAGIGVLLLLISIYLMIKTVFRNKYNYSTWFSWTLIGCIILPYIANTTGWVVTEVGRQPWIVQWLMKTSDGVTPSNSLADIIISFVLMTGFYGIVVLVDIYLLWKFSIAGTKDFLEDNQTESEY